MHTKTPIMKKAEYLKISVRLDEACNCTYYSRVPVEVGNRVVVTTRFGTTAGTVSWVDDDYRDYPSTAKCHVLENASKKLYDKGIQIMYGTKTVEVRHIGSNRKGIFYTDLDLHNGQTVVYEDTASMNRGDSLKSKRYSVQDEDAIDYALATEIAPPSMHVGIVTNSDPDCITAQNWIVSVVDTTEHEHRLVRARQAAKLMAKLEQKKTQFQDIELLRLIAASDPETKKMLDEYTVLTRGQPGPAPRVPSPFDSETPTF